MKKFLIILEYEIMNYIKNKSYILTTVFIAIILGAIMFLPNIFNMSGMLGTGGKDDNVDGKTISEEDKDVYYIYDNNGIFKTYGAGVLDAMFPDVKWVETSNENELKDKITNDEAKAGFVVKSLNEYQYYVYNKGMSDDNRTYFEQAMAVANQAYFCAQNNLDFATVENAIYPEIKSDITVLGKDMTKNFWYCYVLVIVIFMIIIMYGAMVATSVTQEKSNRTIEVLVTSADSNSLFFGKVIAGTFAALFQVGIILIAALGSYKINQDAWGGILDMVFDIPANVLVTFALFGIGGVLFYNFIYGAMGALVSKTEDINKSAGGVQMVIMIVYFAGLSQLSNVDGVFMKVLSYLPISSYSAMFARVAMGSVGVWEAALSFVILVASIVGVGFLGSGIYRMGTLRYGNPIKLSNALKSLRQK